MKAASRALFAYVLIVATALVTTAVGQANIPAGRRVTYYYQTQYYNGNYVSLSPIWEQINLHTHKPVTTDVMIAAFHLGYDSNNNPYIHLNDNLPSDPMFDQMWQEVATLQSYGVTVRMMLGGAAQGSYADLFSNWDTFYPILTQTLQQYNLNGIDMDIEENVTLANAQMLISQLNADFGPRFIMTMAPVASAFTGGPNLSGFSYQQLFASEQGQRINWFNGQFYSGFGSMISPGDYEQIVQAGWPPSKIVAGVIGNPADGSGYVPTPLVMHTVSTLIGLYPSFGGVDCWEYFNALPGGLPDPVEWAADMAMAMGTLPAGTE
jgi:hypothetical protein